MEIVTLSVGELQTNCYLVYDKNSRETLIIDPGDEATFITDEILRLKLTPTAIIATHGHFDHILASWELQMAFGIPFYSHQRDLFLVERMQSSAKHWLGREIVEQNPTSIRDIMVLSVSVPVSLTGRPPVRVQGDALSILSTKIIETPGHTPGGICLAFPKAKIIFTGDTLFANGGIGEYHHQYSSKTDLYKSVALIKKQYKGYLAYPGHGECFII